MLLIASLWDVVGVCLENPSFLTSNGSSIMSRIPLAYPKMPGSKDAPSGHCIAFEKYDGTNLHWVWKPEFGWYAFGVRRNRYDLDKLGIEEFNAAHPGLEKAVSLFQAQLISALEQYFFERTGNEHQ